MTYLKKIPLIAKTNGINPICKLIKTTSINYIKNKSSICGITQPPLVCILNQMELQNELCHLLLKCNTFVPSFDYLTWPNLNSIGFFFLGRNQKLSVFKWTFIVYLQLFYLSAFTFTSLNELVTQSFVFSNQLANFSIAASASALRQRHACF
jgi:hypothetical protein